MEEIQTSTIELGPEYLVIVSQMEPTTNVIKIKVYETKHFFLNPDPAINETHIAQYIISPSLYKQTVADIHDIYIGWAKIDRTQPVKIIGIHNQDLKNLYIQFSLGERYFIYERSLVYNRETIHEELFGKKHACRQRALNTEDEQYLIAKLRFMPKTKKAISFYPYKNPSVRNYIIRRRVSKP